MNVSLLHEFAQNIGPTPRKFSWVDRKTHLRVSEPEWLRGDRADPMNLLFQHFDLLLEHGTVVWGYIIQANSMMFEDGPLDCPGDVVYTLADPLRVNPEYLEHVRNKIADLKGTVPRDPALAPIANHLTDEVTRVFGLPVPASISPGMPCQITSIIFFRKFLQKRQIRCMLVPLLVYPETPYVATVLPQRYWPKKFTRWWAE